MGEAKRRRAAAKSDQGELDVPDCLFWRDFKAEEAGGYTLAGQIIIRRPRQLDEEHMKRIGPAIQAAIRSLVEERRNNPDFDLATFNLDGSQTSVGDKM